MRSLIPPIGLSQSLSFYWMKEPKETKFALCIAGLLSSLASLNLAGNPIEFPPEHVIERGVTEIVAYLRRVLLAKASGDPSRGALVEWGCDKHRPSLMTTCWTSVDACRPAFCPSAFHNSWCDQHWNRCSDCSLIAVSNRIHWCSMLDVLSPFIILIFLWFFSSFYIISLFLLIPFSFRRRRSRAS